MILVGAASLGKGMYGDNGLATTWCKNSITLTQCFIDTPVVIFYYPAFDLGLGLFAFGLISFFGAWYVNITESNLGWGMVQNILQTILINLLGVVIVIGLAIYRGLQQDRKTTTR